jgi:hypothetical protein
MGGGAFYTCAHRERGCRDGSGAMGSARPRSASTSVHARAKRSEEGSSAGACVEAMLKWVLSVGQRQGGELDRRRTRWPHGAKRGTSAPSLGGYVRSTAALGSGLNGTLSAVVASQLGCAA